MSGNESGTFAHTTHTHTHMEKSENNTCEIGGKRFLNTDVGFHCLIQSSVNFFHSFFSPLWSQYTVPKSQHLF